jgi:hypothetical protein
MTLERNAKDNNLLCFTELVIAGRKDKARREKHSVVGNE